jgi:simple sugar transport system substrate-binding protein
VLNRWGGEGVDVVFSTDIGFESSFVPAAEKYPNTRWVLMSDLATKKRLPNLAAHSGDWCEAGFAQGVAAAFISKSHVVAESAAYPILPTIKAYEGMKVGAAATKIPTKVLIKYSETFVDSAKSVETTSALIDEGADVLIAIVSGTTPAIAAQIQSAKKWYIGSYADDTHYAPKATVTSATFDFRQGYEAVAKDLAAGKFTPGIHRYGIKEGFIKLLPFKLGFASQGKKAEAVMKAAATGKYDKQLAPCKARTK